MSCKIVQLSRFLSFSLSLFLPFISSLILRWFIRSRSLNLFRCSDPEIYRILNEWEKENYKIFYWWIFVHTFKLHVDRWHVMLLFGKILGTRRAMWFSLIFALLFATAVITSKFWFFDILDFHFGVHKNATAICGIFNVLLELQKIVINRHSDKSQKLYKLLFGILFHRFFVAVVSFCHLCYLCGASRSMENCFFVNVEACHKLPSHYQFDLVSIVNTQILNTYGHK